MKKYNALLQTLTDFQPEGFEQAAQKAAAQPATQEHLDLRQRTTLSLPRVGAMLKPAAETPATPPPLPLPTPATPVESPEQKPPVAAAEPPHGQPVEETAAVFGQLLFDPNPTATANPDAAPVETVRAAADFPDFDAAERPAPEPRDEAAAVMRVKAAKPKKPKREPEPNEMILMSFRLKKYNHDLFHKTCADRGTVPSRILRNMINQYCGLCLVLAVLIAPPAAFAQAPATGRTAAAQESQKYTTDEIMRYLQNKAFGGVTNRLPAARGDISARHALWQNGQSDPIDDFVYSDYSNTRLEARVTIPIFNIRDSRNRDKEKLEHRAFVMKSLSTILAAQKAVNVTESRLATVRQRRDYVNNQINLKLANRSDLFTIEDNLYSLQALLFEQQSTLEQRIIDLAMVAEDDWLEAYNMIVKWDGVLFPAPSQGGRR